MQEVLQTAVDCQRKDKPLPNSWLLSNRDEGEKCPECEGDIARTKVSSRSTYFCPSCQG